MRSLSAISCQLLGFGFCRPRGRASMPRCIWVGFGSIQRGRQTKKRIPIMMRRPGEGHNQGARTLRIWRGLQLAHRLRAWLLEGRTEFGDQRSIKPAKQQPGQPLESEGRGNVEDQGESRFAFQSAICWPMSEKAGRAALDRAAEAAVPTRAQKNRESLCVGLDTVRANIHGLRCA